MVNDTIDIFDAKIVNVGIDFVVVGSSEVSKYQVLSDAISSLISLYSQKTEIGEPFFITDIYKNLNAVPGVVDTVNVVITEKRGGLYSETSFDLETAISGDGRHINVPQNVIIEIRYPIDDIVGSVK